MVAEPARRAKRAVLLLAVIWAALVVLAPYTLPEGSVGDLSGKVGSLDHDLGWMNPLAQFVYLAGDLNCHTRSERSLDLNGNQMPFCARDVGLFLGLAAGMAVVFWASPRFQWWAVIALAIPIVADGTAQLILDYESTNLVRMATGLMGGVAAAMFLGHVADEVLQTKK